MGSAETTYTLPKKERNFMNTLSVRPLFRYILFFCVSNFFVLSSLAFAKDSSLENSTKALSQPIKILKDGTYIYKAKKSKRLGAASFNIGIYGPLNIINGRNGLGFEEIYGNKPGGLLLGNFDINLTKAFGHLNIRLSTGFFITRGSGRFADPNRIDEQPPEKFTFLLMPNQVAFQYKFQFAETQWFVPYIEGGAGYFTFLEARNDGKKTKLGASPTLVTSGGLQILLDGLNRRNATSLDRDYGVNHLWLLMELRLVETLGKGIDLSSSIITIGFLAEY